METKMLLNDDKYMYEINGWLRTLDYLQQENIHMKTRIAEVSKQHINPIVLATIERYQSLFLNKDTVIVFLRRDIINIKEHRNISITYPERYNTLRSDMEKMEREFINIKNSFNNYMLEVIN